MKSQIGIKKPHRRIVKVKDRASFWQLSHEIGVSVDRLMAMHRAGVLLPCGLSETGLAMFDRARALAILKATGDVE